MPGSVPHAPAPSRAGTIVLACLGAFIAYLPVTTVSISLPAIQRALGATTSELAWVSDAFVLPMAALILTAGVVGDVHGRKKVLLAGLALSAAGAALALTASSVGHVWAGQAVAGAGAAALMPTTLALISHAVPDHRERGRFITMWATSLLLALAVGPLVAGTLLEHVPWRWIYLLPIPAAAVVAVVAARVLPESRAPYTRTLDVPGQIPAALAITSAVFAVIEGGTLSFTEPFVLVAIVVAVLATIAFVVIERRSASPMLDLRVFRSSAFTATTVVAVVSFLGLIGFFFVLSLYFGQVQQLSTLQAAWRLLIPTACSIVVGVPVGWLMHRVPSRWLISTGLVLVGAAMLLLTTTGVGTSVPSLAWRLALLGVGMGAVLTPMTATAVAAVPHHLAGMAAAGNNAFRQVGGALGPAVLGALLSSRALSSFGANLTDAGVPTVDHAPLLATAREGGLSAVATRDLGENTDAVLAAMAHSTLAGIHLSLLVGGILMLLAAVLCVVLMRPAVRGRHQEPAVTETPVVLESQIPDDEDAIPVA